MPQCCPVAESQYLPFLIGGVGGGEVLSPEKVKAACFLLHFYPCVLVLWGPLLIVI